MGIFFRIAIRMVHAMQDSISPGIQKRGALGEESEAIKELLPEITHLKHLMGSIAVQEESLGE